MFTLKRMFIVFAAGTLLGVVTVSTAEAQDNVVEGLAQAGVKLCLKKVAPKLVPGLNVVSTVKDFSDGLNFLDSMLKQPDITDDSQRWGPFKEEYERCYAKYANSDAMREKIRKAEGGRFDPKQIP